MGAALAVVAVLGHFIFFWTTAERKPQLKAGYWDAITSACGGLGVARGRTLRPRPPHLRPIVALSNSKKLWYDSMPLSSCLGRDHHRVGGLRGQSPSYSGNCAPTMDRPSPATATGARWTGVRL